MLAIKFILRLLFRHLQTFLSFYLLLPSRVPREGMKVLIWDSTTGQLGRRIRRVFQHLVLEFYRYSVLCLSDERWSSQLIRRKPR